MISRRRFLSATPLALVGAAATRIAFGAEQNSAPGKAPQPPKIGFSAKADPKLVYVPRPVTTANPAACRILQFTDLHFLFKTASEDDQTVSDCRKQVDRHRPDLIVISGDLWHDNPEGRGQRGLDLVLKSFAPLGVPWTICWGNHDLLEDYQQGHDALAAASNSVYAGAVTHGDYRLQVIAAGSRNSEVALNLFFLNSNDAGLGAWQIEAFGQMVQGAADSSRAVPGLVFFHIPILEYETRIQPATIKGIKLEGVGYAKENGAAFPVLAAAKYIRACFCGHNHTNDYAVRAGTVDLVYGRSTGYAGYGGDKVRKGAKLIEVDLATGNYQQTTVFADGSKPMA
ncbi:MAG: metallophosphoesterase [Verrucomicrobiota bacterium]